MGRLTQMAVFAAVVEHEGFTAAARELGLAKSTISRHIAELEDRLGARLLQRTTRTVRPTEIGLAYYDRCVEVVSAADEADRAATAQLDVPAGRITVAAPPPFASRYLMEPLAAFLRDYPEVEIDLRLDDRLLDIVEEGIDLAIRVAPLEDSSLVARRFGLSHSALVASPAFLAEHGAPRGIELLAELPVLGHALFTQRSIHLHGPDGRVVPVELSGRMRVNDGNALLHAALAGLGVVLAPDFLVGEYVHRGELVPVLPEWTEQPRVVHALYPHRRFLPATVRVLLDRLVQAYTPEPPWKAFCPPQGD